MTLDEHLRRLGNKLFRWRSWTFLPAAGILLIARGHFHYPFGSHSMGTLFELGCLGVALIGLVVRVLTIGYISNGTSGRNTKRQKATALNTTGLYSIMRNPLYFGNYLIFLGMSLLSQSWEIVVINTFLFAAAYVPIILVEEQFLLMTFSNEYRDYASRVPCFIPRPWLWRPADQPWNWRMVLRREHDTLFSAILAFVLVAMVRDCTIVGHIEPNITWIIIGAAGAIVWITLKTLKRLTNLLKPADLAG